MSGIRFVYCYGDGKTDGTGLESNLEKVCDESGNLVELFSDVLQTF